MIEPQRPKIMMKDHKEHFITNPTARLICPNSPDEDRCSKTILEKYVHKTKEIIHLDIWFKIWDTIDWFTNLNCKHECRFLYVDICEYSSSIKEIVLNKVLIFANNRVDISIEKTEISKRSRESILEYRDEF